MRFCLSLFLVLSFMVPAMVEADVSALRAKLANLRANRINWQDSIFSEGSPDFVRPYCFELGQEVTLALQVFKDAPVKKVYLWSRPDNIERVEEMKAVGVQGAFHSL